jgi:hypothetical protein
LITTTAMRAWRSSVPSRQASVSVRPGGCRFGFASGFLASGFPAGAAHAGAVAAIEKDSANKIARMLIIV